MPKASGIMYMTTEQNDDKTGNDRPASGRASEEIDAYGGRGVWVPPGLTAREIMAGAAVLESKFGIEHYEARSMVRWVLQAIRDMPAADPGASGSTPTA